MNDDDDPITLQDSIKSAGLVRRGVPKFGLGGLLSPASLALNLRPIGLAALDHTADLGSDKFGDEARQGKVTY